VESSFTGILFTGGFGNFLGQRLDPHISPESAMLQVLRVAKAIGLEVGKVRGLVQKYTEMPYLGIVDARRVNVLRLNLALDPFGSGG
jgi:K+-transporting ATPase, c chain